MEKDYVMAIDAGSGSCRAIIFDQNGEKVASKSREWLHPTIAEYPGSLSFETQKNWMLICDSIRDVITSSGVPSEAIAAISATSIRFGSVLYDHEGIELWAAPNTDARSSIEVAAALEKGHFDTFYRITGDGLALCDLMRWVWVRKNLPEVWDRVRHFTLISDWILYRLSGTFATDHSLATCSGLFDISRRTWSAELAELYDISLELCPEIKHSGTIIGEVTSRAAAETGLAKGTPVVIGGGDTMAGLLGMACVEKGSSAVIGGTHWQATYLDDRAVVDADARVRISPHMVSNLYMLETNSVYIGLAMRWFRDTFCGHEKALAAELNVDAYYLMEKLAEQAPPGCNGMTAMFANLFNARNWIHGPAAFLQFDVTSPERYGRKEFIRSIQEDAALQSYGCLMNIWDVADVTMDVSRPIVFGGGAANGFLWPQILADVLGRPVKVPVVKEATALGAAICAGIGVRMFDDLSDAARKLVQWDKTFIPDPDNHAIYLDAYSRWRMIYKPLLEMAGQGIVRSLW